MAARSLFKRGAPAGLDLAAIETGRLVPVRPAINRALLLFGLLQVGVGAALLMVPHRFEAGPVTAWHERPIGYGTLAVLAGTLLLWIRILPVRRGSIVAAGLALTVANFAAALVASLDRSAPLASLESRDLHWIVFFAVACLASLAMLALTGGGREYRPTFGLGPSFSVAAMTAQLTALITGVVMLGNAPAYGGDEFAALRSLLDPVGAALWLLGGVLLAATFLPGRAGAWINTGGGILLAAVWLSVGVLLGQEGSWFGVVTSTALAAAALDQRLAVSARLRRRPRLTALAMNSARRRVVMTSATVSLALSLGLTLALATYQETSIRDQIERQQQETAATVASVTATYLTSMMNAVDVAMDFVEVQSLEPARIAVALGDVAWDYPDFANISVVDANGFEIYRSDGRPLGSRATDPAVKRAMGGALNAYGPVRSDPATGQPVMSLATALFSNELRKQVGVVVADLPLTAISDFVQGIAGSDVYDYILVGADGRLISHPDPLVVAQRDTFAMTPAIQLALSGDNGTVLDTTGEEPMLTGYATMPAPWGWGVLVERPERAAVADIRAARDRTFALLGVAALAVVALSLFLAYIVLKPAADLVAPVSAVGEGRWDVDLPAADDSEFGALIRAFGRMRQQIQSREIELVRRNEELSAARLKSQFLMTMTHELRSPMDGILGYGHLLLDGVDGELSPEQAVDVAQMTASAEQLLMLINNVLDFSLLEAGELFLMPVPTDAGPVVSGMRSQFALAAAQKGLDLAFDVPDNLPPVMVDAESMKKILANVIGNAVKFTEQGRVTVTVYATPGSVEIAVADTGIGIPPEAFELIFEDFRQVDSSLNRRYGGAGLGLAIAKRLAELQGARIEVVSQVGIGSTFTLSLPRAAIQPVGLPGADRVAISPVSEVGRRLARLRVLQQSSERREVGEPVGAGGHRPGRGPAE